MLRLRYNTEDWREQLAGIIDKACEEFGLEASHIDDVMWEDAADHLCSDTLDLLERRGVEFEQAHQQSRGAFVIVQDGEPHEVKAFEECLAEALPEAEEHVYTIVADRAAESHRYEIGWLTVHMTTPQAGRWNCGDLTEDDLDTIKVAVPVTVRGMPETELVTLRDALDDQTLASMLEGEYAELID